MADNTKTLSNQKVGIDPTEGLMEYTKSVKPYHSKIMEVLIEYVYKENVITKVNEQYSWVMEFTRPNKPVIYATGFGQVWDRFGTKAPDSFPVARIVNSTAEVVINAVVSAGSSLVSVPYNNIGHVFDVNDRVVFATDKQLPMTTTGAILAGRPYYVVSATPTQITVSDSVAGTPLVFTNGGSGNLTVLAQDLPFNTFLVEQSDVLHATEHPQFEITVTNTNSKQLAFVGVHSIVGVNPATKTWTVNSNVTTEVKVGDTIYVNSDADRGANGEYTVTSLTLINAGAQTNVGVAEPISLLAHGDGIFNTLDSGEQIPGWQSGLAVRLYTDGIYPVPLGPIQTYYFIPSAKLGIFNLAKKRFPTEFEDFVSINEIGSGVLKIRRVEPFLPGTSVTVQSSYLSRNDGKYIIRDVKPEGDKFRVHVMQKVRLSTPASETSDGYMTEDKDTFGFSEYTGVATGIVVKTSSIAAATVGSRVLKLQANHLGYDFSSGDRIVFTTAGDLPMTDAGPLQVGRPYFVVSATESQITVSATKGGQQLTFTSTGTGTMRVNIEFQPTDMHAETYIHEQLAFEFILNLTDSISSSMVENEGGGYGRDSYSQGPDSPFGTYVEDSKQNVATTSGLPSGHGVHILLPMGFDTVFFDFGGLEENLATVSKNYGRTV